MTLRLTFSIWCLTLLLGACPPVDGPGNNGDDFEPCNPVTLQNACDPASATFSLSSTNEYYPLVVGSEVILEGESDGEQIRIERRVLEETEIVDGVETHVLEARELIDGALFEVARNFYVEADDGTVCYFGEDVTFFENGEPVNNDGSWRAGADGAVPGVIMPATPDVGQVYFQENAPGIAQDMGRIDSVTETFTLEGVTHEDVVRIQDSNPIDDEDRCVEEPKLYIRGIGESSDNGIDIVSFTPGA